MSELNHLIHIYSSIAHCLLGSECPFGLNGLFLFKFKFTLASLLFVEEWGRVFLSIQGKTRNYTQTGYNIANNSFAPQSVLKLAVTFLNK